MPYPDGMTYQMNPLVRTRIYPVIAWDEDVPSSVDVLGRYEDWSEALDKRDAFEARFTYDHVMVGEPYGVIHDRNLDLRLGDLV